MAFTCRPEEHHEEILERLCKKLNNAPKSKALLWLIENIEEIEEDKKKYYEIMIKQEGQLKAIKNVIRQKKEAEEVLLNLVSSVEV